MKFNIDKLVNELKTKSFGGTTRLHFEFALNWGFNTARNYISTLEHMHGSLIFCLLNLVFKTNRRENKKLKSPKEKFMDAINSLSQIIIRGLWMLKSIISNRRKLVKISWLVDFRNWALMNLQKNLQKLRQ